MLIKNKLQGEITFCILCLKFLSGFECKIEGELLHLAASADLTPPSLYAGGAFSILPAALYPQELPPRFPRPRKRGRGTIRYKRTILSPGGLYFNVNFKV